MKKSTMLAASAVLGTGIAASVISPAYAWHPQGTIVKQVTNTTAGTAMADANTSTSAVSAKPGDVLTYTITVSNPAPAADKHYNDLAFVKLTDNLPEGVELVSDVSSRQINEDLGTILPGKSVTKQYAVKVTATQEGIIENKACFNGDSVVKDAPRSGCDVAIVKVTVPAVVTPPATVLPPAKVTPPAGTGSQAPAPAPAPVELPKTGPANMLLLGSIVTAAGYALNLLRLRYSR